MIRSKSRENLRVFRRVDDSENLGWHGYTNNHSVWKKYNNSLDISDLVIREITAEELTIEACSACSHRTEATSESQTVGSVFCLAGSLAFSDAVALEN